MNQSCIQKCTCRESCAALQSAEHSGCGTSPVLRRYAHPIEVSRGCCGCESLESILCILTKQTAIYEEQTALLRSMEQTQREILRLLRCSAGNDALCGCVKLTPCEP